MTPRHLKSSRLTPSSTSHPIDGWLNGTGHSGDEVGETSPRGTRRRLKLRVKEPTVSIQHPQHIVPKRLFSSLREWLDSEWTEDNHGPFLLTDDEAREKGQDRFRVLESGKPGGLLSEEKCSVFEPDAQDEPSQQYGHHDHLVAHALNFRSLMQKERNNHARLRRNLNQIAVAAWKARQPKTSEDILQEEQENNRKKYLDVIKDVRHLWEAVTREVERRRMAQWQEQQKALGKQRLHRIIEYSDKLIGPRAERLAFDSNADTAEEGDDTSMEGEEGDTSSENDDDSNMSSSDAESRSEDGLDADDVDAGLTTEELQRKYGDIPSKAEEETAISPTDQTAEADEDIDANHGEDPPSPYDRDGPYELIVPIAGPSLMDMQEDEPGSEHLKEDLPDPSMVEVDEVDDALLDDSDESTDMDDDMGASDQDRGDSVEDSSDEDEGSSDEGDDDRGLLGFFSKSALTVSAPGSPKDTVADTGSGNEGDDPGLPVLSAPASPKDTPAKTESGDEGVEEITPADNVDETIPDAVIPRTPTILSPQNDATEGSEDTAPTSPSDDLKQPDVDTVPFLEPEAAQVDAPISPSLNSSLNTPVPSLLRGTLREYQHYGLDWLAGLYAKNINGILADEMGLGKTIQSIALLAHVAVEHEAWGPHLIVVPTSVMLNWEMEFKKWCPGFKILTYYGTQEERKRKRQGWMDDNAWHVCITSYQLVLQDQQTFKRRNWHYMILDEAHNIKNFQSQRWQTLLSFKTRARLLLTGTPLQNNLTELWSLLAFINPPKEKASRAADNEDEENEGFTDLKTWSEFFRVPANQILEHGRELDEDGKKLVSKLHTILRPYLLRRMKADVEKQMPAKYEHVVSCRLSKRQRILYDGYMALTKTRETLASGNYLSIINTLMQLRKVCNHPDLFETRSVTTSFAMPKSAVADFEIKDLLLRRRLQNDVSEMVNLDLLNLVPISREHVSAMDAFQSSKIHAYRPLQSLRERQYKRTNWSMHFDGSSMNASLTSLDNLGRKARMRELERTLYLESLRHRREPLYGYSLIERLTLDPPALPKRKPQKRAALLEWHTTQSSALRDMVPTVMERSMTLTPLVEKFMCLTPAVVAPRMTGAALTERGTKIIRQGQSLIPADPFHEARMRSSIAFPDKRLLQYDCGKLQRLDKLLRDLQTGGHRALIFTQMTKVLDILEQFLNIHGHRYLRLDGSTKVEQRQALTDRFNNDNRILAFILSSRSGGLGINLTGADTVIFYDLDWNPAMDKQCQDRCHRIGQTREVHIYRFVSEYTIESNILRKANQKRMLDDVIIQEGEFTTDYFNKLGVREMIGDDLLDGDAQANAAMDRVLGGGVTNTRMLEAVEEREDAVAAKQAEREVEHADDGDFEEKSVSQSGVGTPKTPLPLTPRDVIAGASTNAPTPIETEGDTVEASTSLDAAQSGLVDPTHIPGVNRAEEEDKMGHFDDYLLKLVEWTFRDVPIAPPIDKSKKKVKKGQEHRITRVR